MSKKSAPSKIKANWTPKVKFTPQEDQLLLDVVNTYGSSDWKFIATQIEGRNARQCRERWSNYVNPEVCSSPWTTEDEKLLIEKYHELGSRWQAIVAFFPGRATNQIKNKWAAIQRKKKRMAKKRQERSKKHTRMLYQTSESEFQESDNQEQHTEPEPDTQISTDRRSSSTSVDSTPFVIGNAGFEQDPLSFLDQLLSNSIVNWVDDNGLNSFHEDIFSSFI